MTTWTGTWRNQYGSEVVITDDAGGELRGIFRTAIASSPFAGQDVDLVGVHGGSTLTFGSAVEADGGVSVSYTGQLEGGRMETLWFVVSGGQDWWRSVTVNHDTFERVPDVSEVEDR